MFLKNKLKGLAIWKMVIQYFPWVFHGYPYIIHTRVFLSASILFLPRPDLLKWLMKYASIWHEYSFRMESDQPWLSLGLRNFSESKVRHIVM